VQCEERRDDSSLSSAFGAWDLGLKETLSIAYVHRIEPASALTGKILSADKRLLRPCLQVRFSRVSYMPYSPLMDQFVERTVSLDRGVGPREDRTYRFPKIQSSFSSPLVAERNLEISDGCPWQWIVERVASGLKPVGFVECGEQEMREAALQGIAANCAVLNDRRVFDDGSDACWFTAVSQTGRIEECLDIEALSADYQAYFADYPEVSADIDQELMEVGRLDISCFLDYHAAVVDFPGIQEKEKDVGAEFARCGLLLGYPVWSTAALIGTYLQLPEYATNALVTVELP